VVVSTTEDFSHRITRAVKKHDAAAVRQRFILQGFNDCFPHLLTRRLHKPCRILDGAHSETGMGGFRVLVERNPIR
jgi:hypothetical protein